MGLANMSIARLGCVYWCGMWGTAMDFPIVLVGVLYLAHVDDIDFTPMSNEDEEEDDDDD